MDECKPLGIGILSTAMPFELSASHRDLGRGLHSSTFQLNLSAFYGLGSASRGYSGGL